MPARQLRDAFGRQRLTDKARREIDGALLNEGVSTEPSILVVDADELVTVYVAERQPVAAAAGARRGTAWGEYRRLPAWLQLLVPVIAVTLVASVAGGSSSKKPSSDQHAQQARIATQPSNTGSGSDARRALRAERRRAAAARREARREATAERAAERERRARAERRRERQREEQRQLEQAAPPPSDSGSGCDPNYTGACVPTDQGDVNCGDIPEKDFNSIGSDPDRLDADHDGVACES